MGVFEMVVAIVLITTVGRLVSRRLNERRQAQRPADDLLRREVASLRERVATLEQIVTDPAFELKRQIAALETRKAA